MLAIALFGSGPAHRLLAANVAWWEAHDIDVAVGMPLAELREPDIVECLVGEAEADGKACCYLIEKAETRVCAVPCEDGIRIATGWCLR